MTTVSETWSVSIRYLLHQTSRWVPRRNHLIAFAYIARAAFPRVAASAAMIGCRPFVIDGSRGARPARSPSLAVHGDEDQARVAALGQHAVEGGLVGQVATQSRPAVLQMGDGQAVEPLRPALVEVPLDGDGAVHQRTS